ncbi:DUF805 domain-containing protein [Azospirillum sp.]|uniref:DUF805 domain-containing protein n=1 Tax=Azospirillum sp. TaxID=34012 RepID=UPI00260242E0|nr:DUF805 domain-containing protein [Azospirillum sp.]
MGFSDAIRSCLSRYVGFSGRAPRSEYWYWVLFSFLVSIAASVLDASLLADFALGDEETVGLAEILVTLALALPGTAVTVRRLHDIGRSGWWLLLIFVPILGWIALLIWTLAKSDADANRFGPPYTAQR